jgi:hypothetical protein
LPITIEKEKFKEYYDMRLSRSHLRYFPEIFIYLCRADTVLRINYKGVEISKAFFTIFLLFVNKFISGSNISRKQELYEKYKTVIERMIPVVLAAVNIRQQCRDLAWDAARVSNSTGINDFKTIDINGDVWIPHLEYMAEEIGQRINCSVDMFTKYVYYMADKKTENREEYAELNNDQLYLFCDNCGDYLWDIMSLEGFETWGEKPFDAYDIMLFAEMRSNYNDKFYKRLQKIYKEIAELYLDLCSETKEQARVLIDGYMKMLKSYYSVIKKDKTISKELYKKINNFIVFLSGLNDREKFSESVEEDLEMYLLYLSGISINGNISAITKLSGKEIKLIEYILSIDNYDAQNAMDRYNRGRLKTIAKNVPKSLKTMVAYDVSTKAIHHLAELLISIYEDLGKQYLDCIHRDSFSEIGQHENYIKKMKKYMLKNGKDDNLVIEPAESNALPKLTDGRRRRILPKD